MLEKSKQKPFISIIVPVYNVEKYLNQCVDSILNQTFADFELILVDDGSKDASPQICDGYLAEDDRVFVIHQQNSGQVVARKAGLQRAVGEYVFFVDSDDWIELNALEVACQSAKDNDADIVTFGGYFCYSNNRRLPVNQPIKAGVFDKTGITKEIYPKMLYSGRFFYFGIYAAMWNKIFKRSILMPNMVNVDPRLRIGEDGVTTFATFLDANKICVLDNQHLYDYRDNNHSITRSYCANQFDNAKLLIQTLRDINKAKNVYDLSEQIDYYFMYNVYSIFIEEFYYRYKKSLVSRIEYLKSIANDASVKKVVNKIKYDDMPRSFRVFFDNLKKGNFVKLTTITIYIAYKKRIRVCLKKLLGKY